MQVEAGAEAPCPRGGAACCALDGRRLLLHGGADRTPAAFSDFWLLELGEGSSSSSSSSSGSSTAHWTRLSTSVRLPKRRRVLPRSGASLTYLPGPDGAPGKAYLFGGQEPVEGVIHGDLLVSALACCLRRRCKPRRG